MYITDKKTVLHIIGGLMQNPSFLAQVDKYSLTIDDFPDIFTKKIFGAIVNLYSDGAKKINPIDVETDIVFSPIPNIICFDNKEFSAPETISFPP